MPGRIRAYDLTCPMDRTTLLLASPFRAAAISWLPSRMARAPRPNVRRAALEFLATSRMTGWMMAAMEGR